MRASQSLIVSLFNRLSSLTGRSHVSRSMLTLLVLVSGFATPVPTRQMLARADGEGGAVVIDSAVSTYLGGELGYAVVVTGHVSGFEAPQGHTVTVDVLGLTNEQVTGESGTFVLEFTVSEDPVNTECTAIVTDGGGDSETITE